MPEAHDDRGFVLREVLEFLYGSSTASREDLIAMVKGELNALRESAPASA